MDKQLIDLYSWVVRGKQRRLVIKTLDDLKTPTQIREETKLGLNNVSDVLRSFVQKGIAMCVNEKERVGRLYRLTEPGKKLAKKLTN